MKVNAETICRIRKFSSARLSSYLAMRAWRWRGVSFGPAAGFAFEFRLLLVLLIGSDRLIVQSQQTLVGRAFEHGDFECLA